MPKFNTMKTLEERVNPENSIKRRRCLGCCSPTTIGHSGFVAERQALQQPELQELLGIEQPILSQHLTLMRDKGLLNCTKEGKFAHYSIRYEDFHFIIDCIENCCTNSDLRL